MNKEEASAVLDDMKVKIDIPKSAVTQHKRNEALDMAISALSADNTMEWLEDEDGSYECSKCHITRSGLISGVFNFCPNCGRKAVSK